jgi:hypothetical protein
MNDSKSKQINLKFKEFCAFEQLSEIIDEYKFAEQQKKLL